MTAELIAWAIVLSLLAWLLLAWATVASRRDRAGVAVTTATLGAMAASGAMLLALTACYLVGVQ